jgi:hypothetical protein
MRCILKDLRPLTCCWISLLCFAWAAISFGQRVVETSAAPNIEIIKLKWDREVRLPRNFDPAIIPTGGTFNDPSSRISQPPAGTDATRSGGTNRGPAASSNVIFPATPGRLPLFYIYSLKLRNLGTEVIKGIAWDYLFIDPKSNAELGRHQFLSFEKAVPNKKISLHAQLRSPPVRVVRASGSKTRSKFVERAVIQCVLYANGSVWRNPEGRPGVCELLKHERSLLKHESGQ